MAKPGDLGHRLRPKLKTMGDKTDLGHPFMAGTQDGDSRADPDHPIVSQTVACEASKEEAIASSALSSADPFRIRPPFSRSLPPRAVSSGV